MNIVLEITVAELKLGTKGYWSESSDNYLWTVYSLILIVASFIVESSFSVADNGRISVVFGGPVSWYGLAGAVGLFIYEIRKRIHSTRIVRDKIAGDKVVFFRFNDSGIEYGIRNAWTTSYSWMFVTRIDVRPHSFEFEIPGGQVTIRTDHLKDGEAVMLMDFFGKQRELIQPEPFFGWRRSNVGKETFGPMKV